MDYTVAKFDQYTGLQQYTGRAKRVTPTEASNAEQGEAAERNSANRPPPAREGAALEAPPEGPKISILASFPTTIRSQNCIGRVGCGHLHRKNQEKCMQRVAMM